MPKQRHIGFTIFAICSVLSAKIAIFEPEPHELTPAEERWGNHSPDDRENRDIIHGIRYYIYGLGIIGLLMVAEDYVAENLRKNKKSLKDGKPMFPPPNP